MYGCMFVSNDNSAVECCVSELLKSLHVQTHWELYDFIIYVHILFAFK